MRYMSSLAHNSDLDALWQNTLQDVSRERVHLYATHTFYCYVKE